MKAIQLCKIVPYFHVLSSQIYHGWWLQVKWLDMSYLGLLKLKQYTSGNSQTWEMEFSILQVYLHCCWSNCPLTSTLHTCVQLCVEHSNSFVLSHTWCVFYFLHQKVLRPSPIRWTHQKSAKTHTNHIPHICHESHENSRVNFFWPV